MEFLKMNIWEPGEYQGKSDPQPTLSAYLLGTNRVRGEKPRPAVLICPGGGYNYTTPREGEPVALRFAAAGYHAFVLDYSCLPTLYPQALRDVSRALCILREHAQEWRLIPEQIAVCGFSAGGHLAASIGTRWNAPELQAIARMEPGKNRPNALILGYPVISTYGMGKGMFEKYLGTPLTEELEDEISVERCVSADTPPVFLWHTYEDQVVSVRHSFQFAQALREHDIPLEMHIFPHGPHGLSLGTTEMNEQAHPHVANWAPLCIEWLDGLFGVQ